MSKNQETNHKSFYTILGKIGDILLWPVLIISLFSSFFMLVQKKQNKITSIFGYSFVNVLSGSMVDEGFKIGDTVITHKCNERNVQIGDIIAFYYASSTKSPSASDMHLVVEYKNYDYKELAKNEEDNIYRTEIQISDYPKINDKSAEYIKKAQDDKAKVYFHQVVAIYIDDEGNMFFKTKGSNNSTADTPLTRGDLIVGKYVTTPVFIRRAVSFCASPLGMIVLVCFPLSMLVLMQCLSLIEQVSIIALEKKLLSGELSYKDEEIKKNLSSNQIESYNKVYYYYITPDEQKPEVKEFLWGDLLNVKIPSDKQLIDLARLNNSLTKLESSDLAYWNEWIEKSKGIEKKKLIQYKNKLFMPKIDNNISQKTNSLREQDSKTLSNKKQELENKQNQVKHKLNINNKTQINEVNNTIINNQIGGVNSNQSISKNSNNTIAKKIPPKKK